MLNLILKYGSSVGSEGNVLPTNLFRCRAKMSTATCTDLILDIGGVVMTYSLKKAGTISHHTLGAILDSLSWHDYERAKVSKRECYDSISTDFKLPEGALETALSEAAASLKPNYYFIEEIKRLKQECPKIRVHAFSNISQPDFDEIEAEIMSWGLFDNVLTSAAIKCRKPELQSYSLVLDRIKSDASSCVFVDDKLENVMAAHSLGMKGILFKTSEETVTSIYNLIGDPVQRGSNFLQERSRNLFSETEGGMTLKDNFSQLLILYSTGNRYGLSQNALGGTTLIGFVVNSFLSITRDVLGSTLLELPFSRRVASLMISTQLRWQCRP